MSSASDPPDAPPAAPGEGVLSLDEARRRRAERLERLQQRARSQQAAAEHGQRRRVLIEALREKRISWVDLSHLLLLGIVTLDEVPGAKEVPITLPCQDRGRDISYFDWHQATYRPDTLTNPEKGLRLRLQTSQVRCPLIEWALVPSVAPEPPACVNALHARAREPQWHHEEHSYKSYPVDENDPVIKHQVRPCQLLGEASLYDLGRAL